MPTTNNKKERKLPIITVFTAVVKYLKDLLFEQLKKAHPNANFQRDDVQWIITVPAIWKSGARQLMREAAIKVIYNTVMYLGTLRSFCYIYHLWLLNLNEFRLKVLDS